MTEIVSSRSKASPITGEPTTTPVTPGGPWDPSTLWAAAAAIAFAAKPSLALAPTLLRIVPPFSASAPAPTPIPSESESAAVTT